MAEIDETGLLREIHELLKDDTEPTQPPKPPQKPEKEIDWSEYDFHFEDETPAAPPEPAPPPLQEEDYSIDYMRRLHQSAGAAPHDTEPAQPVYLYPQPTQAPVQYPRPTEAPAQRSRPTEAPTQYPQPTEAQAQRPRPTKADKQHSARAEKKQAAAPAGEQPGEEAMSKPKGKKKHRFLKFLLWLVICLAALLLVLIIAAELFGKPATDEPIGTRKSGCSTILLVGTDAEETRTDTIMLLHIDRPNKVLRLLSIPRDTKVNGHYSVPKINGAYGVNGGGEEGMEALLGYVSDLIGYRPDGYMLIHLDCFVELVDKMGGVDFDVPADMYYDDPTQDLHIDLKTGMQHLNGEQAMGLVRFRSYGADYIPDFMRTKVQREFMAAAFSQWKKFPRVLRAPGALGLLLGNTDTDLNLLNLAWIADSVVICGTDDMENDRLPSTPGSTYVFEDVQEAADLINGKYNPYETTITADDLHPGT